MAPVGERIQPLEGGAIHAVLQHTGLRTGHAEDAHSTAFEGEGVGCAAGG